MPAYERLGNSRSHRNWTYCIGTEPIGIELIGTEPVGAETIMGTEPIVTTPIGDRTFHF